MSASERPLLFLDVDGPLIPFGAPRNHTRVEVRPDDAHPLLHRVQPEHGRLLAALPCDLVWASTWMSDANDVLAPLLGLPALPVVDWPDSDEGGALHWKTRGLVEWAQGRPFVWVDDEISPADRAWVSTNHHGPALLHRVDPRYGLTARDFTVVRTWLEHGAPCRPSSVGRASPGVQPRGARRRSATSADGVKPAEA